MASLPIYHQVPTDEKSAVDFYHDEQDISKIHPASIGNGAIRLPTEADLEKKKKVLPKWKKALVALALVWFTYTVFGHIGGKGHGHHHGVDQWKGYEYGSKDVFSPCHGDDKFAPQEDELKVVPTVYGTTISLEDNRQIANASFSIPLHRRKAFNVHFGPNVDANIIISKSEITLQDDEESAQGQIIVESSYENEHDVKGVEMKSGKWFDELSISAEGSINHKVHLILPSSKSFISSPISISSAQSLNFEIDSSASGITFRDLKLKSDSGDINVPSIVGSRVELESTTGTVGGIYNVSKALILKTVTGNIDAKVHVLPPWNGPSRRPPPPHGGDDKHKPKHHKDDDDEQKPKHHAHDDHDDDEDEEDEEGHQEREHRHHKKSKHHKKRQHHKKRHDKHSKRSWLSSLLSPFAKPPPPPPGPPGPPGPPPPKPAFIGANSIKGSVNITILSQGSYTSSEIRASSTSNNVTIQHAENFRGFYDISSSIGKYNVSVPEKYKDHHVLTVGETEHGGFQHGLVGFKRPKGEKPPKKKLPPGNETDFEVDMDSEVDMDMEKREWNDQPRDGPEGEHPPPPPPPPPPPHGPPGPPKGDHPPPPPPPHGPEGHPPPPPPPHGPPGPPKGDHPPPPPPPPGPPGPPKGDHPPPPPPPGGDHPPPPPPHGPPRGPPGPGPFPPPGPPPPPGHSRVFAHADIGNVQIVL
ncbi:hypothetical protein V865_004379 [Kwoniella europaea PYCC6329]|uniref:Adhesin domain-containing protein n=1 Tax=Kwoniella europaea PYCC6329 TaxID=1423913 RepID=A0AAX4KJF2_9TREE